MGVLSNKSGLETIKTIALTAVIAIVIGSFIGYNFSERQHSETNNAIHSAVEQVKSVK